jgi:hypothetical protein
MKSSLRSELRVEDKFLSLPRTPALSPSPDRPKYVKQKTDAPARNLEFFDRGIERGTSLINNQ